MTNSGMQVCSAEKTGSFTSSRSIQVKTVFENVQHYLNGRPVDIRMRAETVKAFAARLCWRRLLDVGCGDGSVTLPLLSSSSHLTLLDLSSSMVAGALARVPQDLRANVEVRNENFMTASFARELFGVIVSVGVLAHVDSPEEFIAKLKSLSAPDGILILEFTDCRHFLGRLSRFVGWIKEQIAPAKYQTNRLSFSEVAGMFERQQLHIVSIFRYANVPLPGVERLIAAEVLYRLVRLIFGNAGNNRNAWLGNEYICLVRAV